MKKIQLNIARKKKTELTGHGALLPALFILASLFTLYNWHAYKDTSIRLTRYRDILSSLGTGPAKTEIDAHLKRVRSEVEIANKVLSGRSFSWTEVLTGLEKSLPDGALLLQINPDFDKMKITFSGLGTSMESILGMVDSMNRSEIFREAVLVRHSEDENAAGHGKPDGMIHFSITSYYDAERAL